MRAESGSGRCARTGTIASSSSSSSGEKASSRARSQWGLVSRVRRIWEIESARRRRRDLMGFWWGFLIGGRKSLDMRKVTRDQTSLGAGECQTNQKISNREKGRLIPYFTLRLCLLILFVNFE